MQKAITVVLVLAVQVAALNGALLHAHLDDHATEHHAGRVIHSHWTGHDHSHRSSHEPTLAPEEHDGAVFLTAFVTVPATSLPALEVAQAVFESSVPPELKAHGVVDAVHSHDPPFTRSLPSRAPPTFLS